MAQAGEVTVLLRRVSAGDKDAESELLPRVYAELKRLALSQLRSERPGHTLQATALVHEAYMRLANQQEGWNGRAHFYALAAKVMRRILTDYARQRNAGKRGGGKIKLSLDEHLGVPVEQCPMLTDLDEALERLEEISPRQAKIIELRFFGGLTEDEVAEVIGVSSRTVKRQWESARAWLYGELSR